MSDDKTFLQDIRLFLFDLDGTLLRVRPSGHEAMMAYTGEAGFSFDREAQARGLLWSHTYWADLAGQQVDRDALGDGGFWHNYVRRYLEALGVEADDLDSLSDIIRERFHEEFEPVSYLVSGAKELLWDLRNQEYIVGLLSNRKEPLTGVAIEFGIIDHFHFTLAAGQAGAWKPDSAIFEQALDMAGGVAPEEAVYIGDNYYTDGIGARDAGMKSILVDEFGIYDFAASDCTIIRKLSDLKRFILQ